jgi:hypothetical protein
MCVVSMVHDQFKQIPLQQWTYPIFNEYQEIIDRIKRLEDKLAVPPCEDAAKAKWMQDVRERLSKLEQSAPQGPDPKVVPNPPTATITFEPPSQHYPHMAGTTAGIYNGPSNHSNQYPNHPS